MYLDLSPGRVGIQGLDLDQSIALARDTGFAGLDLPRDAADTIENAHAAREKIARAGLRWGICPKPFDWTGEQATWRDGLDSPDYSSVSARRW